MIESLMMSGVAFMLLPWYFILVGSLLVIASLFFMFSEESTIGSFITIVFIYIFLTQFNIVNSPDLYSILLFILAYAVIGILWSFFMYAYEIRKEAKLLSRYPDHTKEDILKNVKREVSKDRIHFWILFFPVSILKFLLGDFVNSLIEKMSTIYNYIANKVVESVLEKRK